MKTEKIIIKTPEEASPFEAVIALDKRGESGGREIIVMGTVKGDYNLDLVLHHRASQSVGKILVRGVAKNGARVSVKGRIIIDKNCVGVDSFLDIRLLVLDSGSQAVAVPELEIESADVKASHAVAISGVDEEQLFYLMSRGLSEERAEELIVEGFLR